jgi:hypothetical protein
VRTGAILGAVLVLASCVSPTSRGDDFDRLDGPAFFDLLRRPDARARPALSLRELEGLPAILRDRRTSLLLVKTDEGNLAKMIVSSAFRKRRPSASGSGQQGPLVPVLLLERFATLDAGDLRSFKARGADLVLYDGFQLDLDSGQVVPEGLGGDILFATQGTGGPRLAALGTARLYTLEQPLPSATAGAGPGRPSSERGVQPEDFAGRYLLVADGHWSGTLVLTVGASGVISGHFRSNSNGSVYPVAGNVDRQTPHKMTFTIQFPRAQQSYDGLLWTEGKNAFAGTMVMLDRRYSFIALREGAKLVEDPGVKTTHPALVPAKEDAR